MASKYDAYWGGQLHRIRAELQLAATGVPAVVSVPDLARRKAGWPQRTISVESGSVRVAAPANACDAPAVLAFELANRAYFAASVSDRGDEFYDQFTERHNALLAEQEAGTGAFYVLVAEDGSVLGRFNLYRLQDGTAELGYRVAERVAGRAWRPRPCGSCAGWRCRGTACASSGQRPATRMSRPRRC